METYILLTLAVLVALAFLESRIRKSPEEEESEPKVPATPGEIFAAAVPTVAVTLLLTWLCLRAWSYGAALFILLPVVCGFVAGWLLSLRHPRSASDCSKVAVWALMGSGVGALAIALEGAICLMMALPFAVPVALVGGGFAFYVQEARWLRRRSTAVLLIVLLGTPAIMGAEAAVAPEPPLLRVRTEIVVDAPPEAVWPRVVSFPALPEEREWLFRTGIAYPKRAEIHGRGPGALRLCVFSTGSFVEPIEVWDEPRLLRFAVTQSPPSLEEWSPWGDIRPPHTDSSFQGEAGQFELHPLPGGRTLLVGTTWYRNDLAPAFYWRLWSDAIIHRVHRRVLRHIAGLAEADAA
jgi:hypothetical protein